MRRAAALLAMCACAGAGGPVRQPTDPRTAQLDALVTSALAATPTAAASVSVVAHSHVLLEKGYGAAAPDSIFRVGSITKQFTAVAILQLAAAGKLGLDDDLARYLPEYPLHGQRVTLRELLQHTSGIRDYEHGIPWFAEHMAEARTPGAGDELIAQFAAAPFDFPPGTRWSYSNSGYYLLGRVIERVFGESYEAYLRAHVLPAGVTVCPDDQDDPRAVRGTTAAGAPAPPIKMVYAYAAGELCATAPALVAWETALAHGPAFAAMTTPVTLADGSHFGYGLGLFVGDLGGHRAIFHGGSINGFAAALAVYPDDDLHVAVLVGRDGTIADALVEAIARRVLGVPAPAAATGPLDPARAAAIAGHYAIAAAGIELVVDNDHGVLSAGQAGDPKRVPMIEQTDGSFEVADLRLVFVVVGGRATKVIVMQGGAHLEGARVEP